MPFCVDGGVMDNELMEPRHKREQIVWGIMQDISLFFYTSLTHPYTCTTHISSRVSCSSRKVKVLLEGAMVKVLPTSSSHHHQPLYIHPHTHTHTLTYSHTFIIIINHKHLHPAFRSNPTTSIIPTLTIRCVPP